jgi:hypothetical protein
MIRPRGPSGCRKIPIIKGTDSPNGCVDPPERVSLPFASDLLAHFSGLPDNLWLMLSFRGAFSILIAVWLVAACGGDKAAPASNAEPAPSEPAPAPAAPTPSEPAPSTSAPPSAANEPRVQEPAAAADPKPATTPSAAPAAKAAPTTGASHSDKPAPARTPHEAAAPPTKQSAQPATPAETAAATPTPSPATPAPAAQPLAAGPCGDKGQPRCPLQAWMEDHLQSALDKKDTAALAKGLTRAANFAPDASWNAGPQGWSAIATAGVDAAKSGDIAATQAACKSCHKAWRTKYKQTFRTRIIAD